MGETGPTEAEILFRVCEKFDSSGGNQLFRPLPDLCLPDADRDRLNELAAKAREGPITPAERAELETYRKVQDFIDQIKDWNSQRNANKRFDSKYEQLLQILTLPPPSTPDTLPGHDEQ